MSANSYHSRPQREEYFVDSGYYKFHEAYHLLKFSNERQILEMAYNEYLDLRKSNLWETASILNKLIKLFSTFTVTCKNAFKITFVDGIFACMSRDFGIFMPKHLAVLWLLNSYK